MFGFGFRCRQSCYLSQHALGIEKHKLVRTQDHSGTHILKQTHTDLQVPPPRPSSDVFLSSIVKVCVTDLISPTICWLDAQRCRSDPAWQIQTASVYACFSQGLTQYGRVESPCWPPSLHPYISQGRFSVGLGCSYYIVVTIFQTKTH